MLVFAPSLSFGWLNWDDDLLLTSNPFYRGLGWAQIRWAFTSAPGGAYQPLGFLSYGLDYLLWGMDPRGYHLTSVLLHALNAALVFFAARRLLAAAGKELSAELDAAAVFVALVFALHPLRVESVSWIAERRDPLSGAFWLGAVLAYLHAPRRLWAVHALFAAACLAKATAVTLPLVLLIADVAILRRPWKAALGEKVPMLLFAAALGGLGVYWQGETRAAWSWADHGLAARLAQACYALVFYARKTLWPSGLFPLYALDVPLLWTQPRFLASIAAVAAAAVLWRYRRAYPRPAFAALAYALILLPVSGLAQSGAQLVADRYSYLACLPWAMLAGGAYLAASRRRRVATAVAAVVAAGALAAACLGQQQHWRDSEALWTRVLSLDPRSGVAHDSLGVLRAVAGRSAEARDHFQRALDAYPGCVADQDRLAAILEHGGGSPEEERRLRAAVETHPVCRKARANLGTLRAQTGDLAGAVEILSVSVLLDPDDIGARLNLARARAKLRAQRLNSY
jgi:tetratricopeptide (TPR) repeat protein